MIILGLDPGYGTTGYGVLKYEGVRFTPIQYGAITTAPGQPFHHRLCEIYNDVCTLIDTFHPDECAMEEACIRHPIRRRRSNSRSSATERRKNGRSWR